MKMALREAKRGIGATSPNPRVGAVIVKDNRVISRGYHRSFGAAHAEADCLSKLPVGAASSATLYVTLEPCSHHGKTPPCASAIAQSGITRVVYGLRDPNPLVDGKGFQILTQSGIEVHGPVLEEEAREVNRGYLKFLLSGRPWVTLKWAQSLDGRIATQTGDSRWISGRDSQKLAHRLRAEHDAVLVGLNTVLQDDPRLTVRHVRGRNPRRVILDADLRLPLDAALLDTDSNRVMIVTRPNPPSARAKRLEDRGAELLRIPVHHEDILDIEVLLMELGKRGILYLLVEGGSQIITSFIRQSLFDEIVLFVAPKFVGSDGVPGVASLGISRIEESVRVEVKRRRFIGQDLAIWLRTVQVSNYNK